jgi:myo-inositol 2-dehydrogenase/D-chiro-inositol 1-dehydrogenase
MTIRIGVIGVGVMGAEHARRLHRVIGGASVCGVTDFAADRAEALAAELGARVFGSAEELIDADDVDAVVIASRDADHSAQVMSCLAHGKPVLCEKPLAPTLAECRAVVDAQTALALPHPLVSVGFMRRFDPGYTELAAVVRSGAVGESLLVRCSHRNVAGYPGGDSAETITNTAIHEIDITRWLFGSEIIEVSWHAGKSVNARYGYDVRCEVVGDTGATSLAATPLTRLDQALQSRTAYPKDWLPRFAEAYRLQLQAWIDSLAANQPSPLATAEDGLAATAVAAALIESMNDHGACTSVKQP